MFDLCDTERSGFIAVSHLQDLCKEQGKVCQYSLLSVSSVSDSAFCLLQDICREQGKVSQYFLLSVFSVSDSTFCLLPSAGTLYGAGQG